MPTPAAFRAAPLIEGLGFGVEVTGLDPAALQDAATRRALHDLWIREGVIVFRGLTGDAVHLELSRCFGPLMAHPVRENRAVGAAELTPIHFRPEDGYLQEVDGELRGVFLPWHCDMIYLDKINRGGILRPVKLPSRLGQTGFIDKIGAYERLPQRLKTRIEGLRVVYEYQLDPGKQKYARRHEIKVIRMSERIRQIWARIDEFPRVSHPLAYRQAETGRMVLNLSPWFAAGIVGMSVAEGDALLEEVAGYSADEAYAYLHDWRMDDMVLWDNWRVLHSSPGTPAAEERSMFRTSIEGDYGLGRVEGGTIDLAAYVHV
jgi:taurine dioxygenase